MEQKKNKDLSTTRLDPGRRAGYLTEKERAGMADRRTIDELKEQGAGRPASEGIAALYREAFARFGAHALWSRKPSAAPTIAQALVVAQGLRNEGDMRARPLAARIEDACRAAL